MSQMMRAVFFGSQVTLRSATVNLSVPAALARERRLSCRAPSAALAVEANVMIPSNAPRMTVVGQVFIRAMPLYGPASRKKPDRIQVAATRGGRLSQKTRRRDTPGMDDDYSAAGSAEAAASTARFANHRFRNGFSTNKARSAEIKS